MTHMAIGLVSNTAALHNRRCVGGRQLGGLSSVPVFSFLCSGRICFSATFPSKHSPDRSCLLHRFLNDEMVWLLGHNKTKNSKMKKQQYDQHTYKKQLYTWVKSRDQKKKLKLIFSNLSLTARAKNHMFWRSCTVLLLEVTILLILMSHLYRRKPSTSINTMSHSHCGLAFSLLLVKAASERLLKLKKEKKRRRNPQGCAKLSFSPADLTLIILL